MKPRDLTGFNWDVAYAVFETPELEARVTADGERMWFLLANGLCRADVLMPIKDFRKAAAFVDTFDVSTLTPDSTCFCRLLGSWAVEIVGYVGSRKRGKSFYKKMPTMMLLRPWRKNTDCSMIIRLSLFKKLIRWYNTEI